MREKLFLGVPELKSGAGAHFPARLSESRGWDNVGATRNPQGGLIYVRLSYASSSSPISAPGSLFLIKAVPGS